MCAVKKLIMIIDPDHHPFSESMQFEQSAVGFLSMMIAYQDMRMQRDDLSTIEYII